VGQYSPNFHVEGDVPTNHFSTDRYANECPTILSLTVFTQKNYVADFLQANAILDGKHPFCVFEPPLRERASGKRTMIILGLLESA